MELLGQMVILYFIFEELSNLSTAIAPFYIPTSHVWGFQFSCQILLLFIFLITAILMGRKRYLIVVLISILLMDNNVEHLLYWPFVYILWKNVYSGPLTISQSSYLCFCCWGEFFLHSKYKSLARYMICKYFLPFSLLFQPHDFLCFKKFKYKLGNTSIRRCSRMG